MSGVAVELFPARDQVVIGREIVPAGDVLWVRNNGGNDPETDREAFAKRHRDRRDSVDFDARCEHPNPPVGNTDRIEPEVGASE